MSKEVKVSKTVAILGLVDCLKEDCGLGWDSKKQQCITHSILQALERIAAAVLTQK